MVTGLYRPRGSSITCLISQRGKESEARRRRRLSVKEAPWFQVRVIPPRRSITLVSSWHVCSLFLWSWRRFSGGRASRRRRCRRNDSIIIGTSIVVAVQFLSLTMIMRLHTTHATLRHDYCATFAVRLMPFFVVASRQKLNAAGFAVFEFIAETPSPKNSRACVY